MIRYDRVNLLLSKLKEGVSKSELNSLLSAYWDSNRTEEEKNQYLLSKRPFKFLKEEVAPVCRFLNLSGYDSATVCFPQNNHAPDCWLRLQDGTNVGIEVTRAMGRSRNKLSEKLVEDRVGSGFIPVLDGAQEGEFQRAIDNSRRFANEGDLSAMAKAIKERLVGKADRKYEGMILVIDVNFNIGANDRFWETIIPGLCLTASKTHFREVHLVGEKSERKTWFVLKSN